ncbi:EAL domain-containing protein [Marinobacter halodurans]|uniref:EAL domain-containing protein n=1 Tax=Marinobacter halodurans TaxID=2528979 RepID=A0ABY1ZTJ0_9GAMM|nr:EAL domain-containing protein [Marinobacter halodurans]TBW58808.1 EAL domain-containing protein [Marinobacter halodurans]
MLRTVLLFALLGVAIIVVPDARAGLVHDGHVEPAIDYILFPDDAPGIRDPVQVDRLGQWQSLAGGETPNFGYIQDVAWFRFQVPTPAGAPHQILEISYPQLDSVHIYLMRDGKQVGEMETGDRLPMSSRQLRHPHFLYHYTVDPGHEYRFLIRVQTNGALQVPISIWQRDAFFNHISEVDQAHAIYYGILITVIFFNLFVFLAMREATYLYYALSTFGYLFLLSSLRGATYPVLWPDNPWLQNQSMMMSVPIAVLFSLLFARSFLELRRRSPRLDRVVRAGMIINLLAILGSFLLEYNISMRLSVALAIPSCLLLTFIGPLEWFRGNRPAKLYTIAWGLLTLGSAMTAANKYGWIPTNFVTEFGMEIGSALEALLLTIALAARLYQEREDKVNARESQLRALAARRKAELRMMEQALHNPLTGLPNRSSFELQLQDLLARESSKRHAVGIVRINNLDTITRTLGHQNADRVMELAARRFNGIFRDLPGVHPTELGESRCFHAASLESAAFGFIVDADEARRQPRRIIECLEAIRTPIDYLGMQLPLEPLAGVAVYPDHGTDTNTLIRKAYVAQESDIARDRGLAYYHPEQDSYSADRLTLASSLRDALRKDELALFFQPKQSLVDERIVGVEALIRWPGRKTPTPADQIIAVAEQTGLIKPLTRWVLEKAMVARSELVAAGYPQLSVSVNISPNNLREQEFPLFVQRLMSSHPQHTGKIILEVTETSMMLDPANSLRALRSLDYTGIPLSIDDFGSGYSSLSYIKRLPAREIKIDRSLITDLTLQAEDRVIVQTTINMCHDLGYKVVAEGVEDAETAELLAGMDCDMIQGFHLASPQPMEALLKWLSRQGDREQRRA